MLKNGLNCVRTGIPWGLLLTLILMSGAWVDVGRAQPTGTDPAVQAGTGAKASAPPAQATSQPAAKSKVPRKVAAKRTSARPAGGGPPVSAVGKVQVPEIVGRRDPFKLPPPPVPGRTAEEEILGPLPTGKRGLLISQLRLEGIVRLDTTNTLIAVVDNNSNRAYFLRENDAVYNGVVSKITPDSVYFRENVLDASGHVLVREVVRRLSQGPGEGR
jgi:hypothetical protein